MRRFAFVFTLLALAWDAAADISFTELAKITLTPERHQGRFIQQKYLQAVDASLQSSGVFDFERGKSVRWEILEPIHSKLLMTAEGISGSDNGETLLQLEASANPAVAALGEIFFAVLTSDWATLENRVELSGSIEGENWHAVLHPKDESTRLVFTRLELFGSQLLEKIVLHENNGNRTTIQLDPPA